MYCAVDPATAILEVAVHKGFRVLDTLPHILTAMVVADPSEVHVVDISSLPNPHWLNPGFPSAGQQQFGDTLLERHPVALLPSVVSRHSWNLVFEATNAAGRYALLLQEAFGLDPRLHPPSSSGP